MKIRNILWNLQSSCTQFYRLDDFVKKVATKERNANDISRVFINEPEYKCFKEIQQNRILYHIIQDSNNAKRFI